ncbi:MAG: hypothetical protein MUF18_04755 [Fimbriiglobus sp.]|nr:hypothetical protein [Fimbriiglobus sp.]
MLNNTVEICTPYPPRAADGRPLRFDPQWRTETVSALARGIDLDAALDRLPILADALEEAGCDVPAVLVHCRTCPHAACTCWVVNLALGRPVDPPPPITLDSELAERLRRAAEQRGAVWAHRPTIDPPLGLRHLAVISSAGLVVLWFALSLSGHRLPPKDTPRETAPTEHGNTPNPHPQNHQAPHNGQFAPEKP